ncbi:hypothetical protein PGTUg99_005431 [Puccinia graminis f. sp. tritici]|uniref:Uncharacterized protein n=1 Tax=Puccinia graminis f. sp. tritici TaxID=56615 RepID=A0A5B0S5C0_PUCGR|nr:hypothetical protein PGTUg99_005431 [Puccinia graminis f. sp. tritici]
MGVVSLAPFTDNWIVHSNLIANRFFAKDTYYLPAGPVCPSSSNSLCLGQLHHPPSFYPPLLRFHLSSPSSIGRPLLLSKSSSFVVMLHRSKIKTISSLVPSLVMLSARVGFSLSVCPVFFNHV